MHSWCIVDSSFIIIIIIIIIIILSILTIFAIWMECLVHLYIFLIFL